MESDLVICLYMPDWTGVKVCMRSSVCGEGAAAGAADVDVVPGACFAASACLWTSSFRTRPSLPVPSMSSIFNLRSFSMPRTAGVASDACFPGCRCGFACSVEGSGGREADCSDDSISSATALVSFLPTSNSCSCGSVGFGAASAAPLSDAPFNKASSAADISLWISISTSGF